MGGCPSAVKEIKTLSNLKTTNEETKDPGPPDVTANFPNDGLCHVLSYIASMQDRFRVAAVNRKFRRCMLREMKKPMPLQVTLQRLGSKLEFQWQKDEQRRKMGGGSAGALAGIVNFNKIIMHIFYETTPPDETSKLDRFFNILCEFDCLDQVTEFDLTEEPNSAGSYSFLTAYASVIARCRKLSALRFTNSMISCKLLAEALKNKPLTEMTLKNTSFYPHDEVINVFRSLKQNTLQNVHLSLRLLSRSESLALPELVQQLGTGAWAALERIHLELSSIRPIPQLGQLFQSLGGSLPSLKFCKLQLIGIRPDAAQLAPALVSLFNQSSRTLPLKFILGDDYVRGTVRKSGCWFMELIRQVQDRYPPLQIELDLWNVKMASNAFAIEFPLAATNSHGIHNDIECVQCRHFYPNVIKKLSRKAKHHHKARGEVYYLRKNRLDRCKLDKVVYDCNRSVSWLGNTARAVRIDQTHRLATVTFQKSGLPFYIRVNCGPCFSKSCVPCLLMNIDY